MMAKREDAPQGDVLLYYRRGRREGVVWNDPLPRGSKGATVPIQHRHVIEPRLGFCPGAKFAKVSSTPSYQRLRDEERVLTELAGHDGDLAQGIAALPEHEMIEMIEVSAGLTTLDRIQTIESASDSPRLAISEAIELRKKDLAVEIAKAKRKHDHSRRANQRRMKRRGRGATA